MVKLWAEGGIPLKGVVRVSGAKNAALALIAASVLADGEVILENVPCITDIKMQLEIARELGVKYDWLERQTLLLRTSSDVGTVISYEKAKKLRASNLFLGALLAKGGGAELPLPGGCSIGDRPMDLHFKGFRLMGADLSLEHGYIQAAANGLRGNRIYLDFPSVGATENIMMGAVLARGRTVIENAAKEPEVVDLANFLNAMGAQVRGAGTPVIRIRGVENLKGIRYSVIPDRVEAGTYLIAASATGGKIIVKNIIATHLLPVLAKLAETGVWFSVQEDQVKLLTPRRLQAVDVKTLPYPGYPTDLQSPLMALLAKAQGTSLIVENIFENRFQLAGELSRMGAEIKVTGRTAVIKGVDELYGSWVKACDLRAGMALIIAGLSAQGKTVLEKAELINRGYEDFVSKLQVLGAGIGFFSK